MVMECKVEEKTRQAVDNAVRQQTRQAVDNAVKQQRDHSRFTYSSYVYFAQHTKFQHTLEGRKEGLLDVTSTGGVSSMVSPHAYNNNNNGHFSGALSLANPKSQTAVQKDAETVYTHTMDKKKNVLGPMTAKPPIIYIQQIQ